MFYLFFLTALYLGGQKESQEEQRGEEEGEAKGMARKIPTASCCASSLSSWHASSFEPSLPCPIVAAASSELHFSADSGN
jgi:hypothetical protein